MTRVIIIGLDGFGPAFTRRVFDAGLMPFLASRAGDGVWGPAASTVPPVSTAAWTTITTGVGIGRHGIVDFRRRTPADYGFTEPGRFVNGDDVRAPRLYDLAGEAGARCFVLNVPVTYPAREINGVMVAGMLTPPGSDRGCWPADFRQHLADYSYDLDEPVPADLPALCRRLEDLATGRARVAEAAFGRERFDLGMVVFTGPDRLFHRHYAEVCAPEDPAAIPPPAASYLRTLDGACERICAAFGEDAAFIICSDHGFGPGPRQAFFVNRALKKAGLLAVRPAFSPYALNIMLFGLKKLLGKAKPLPVDWRRSAAYGFPLYMGWGGVFLNVRGEQPEGIVDTADVAGVAERVARALEDSAATRWVKTRAELYDGPAITELPHVVFEAEAGTVVSEGKGPGPLVAPYEDARKLGEHTSQAIMAVAGGGVSAQMPASPGIADVAATAAALLGLDVRPFDGVPWAPIS